MRVSAVNQVYNTDKTAGLHNSHGVKSKVDNSIVGEKNASVSFGAYYDLNIVQGGHVKYPDVTINGEKVNDFRNTLLDYQEYVMVGFEYGPIIQQRESGYVYVDENGKENRDYDIKEVTEKIAADDRSIAVSKSVNPYFVNNLQEFHIKRNDIDEAVRVSRMEPCSTSSRSPLAKYFFEKGMLNAAREFGDVSSLLKDKGLSPDGTYRYEIPKTEDVDNDYLDKIHESIESEAKNIMFRIDDAVNAKLYKPENERIAEGILTLGISEIVRAVRGHKYRKELISAMQSKLDSQSRADDAGLIEQIEKQNEKTDKTRQVISNMLSLEEKKEAIRERLEKRVVTQIKMSEKGADIEVPNCVMFEGENPYMTEEFARWTAEVSGADYVVIPSNPDNEKMQSDLASELEASAQNMEKNRKRTVIFVEGMEKLIDPKMNSKKNIAKMKEIMQKTDSQYNATIIFHTFDKSKLDAGATGSNRVGLRIKSDISYDDADVLKSVRTKKGVI